MQALDFFCGAGGLTRGLLDAGIEVVAGVDNDPRVGATYKHNNSPSRFICADIRTVSVTGLRAKHGITGDQPVLYSACTPCQPFSTLNPQRKDGDKRRFLLLAFADVINRAPPDYLVIENVPGLRNATGREVFQEFEQTLARQGFRSDAAMLDAKDFGVPQTRKRFVLIASRHGQPHLPAPTTEPDEFATVSDAIRRFPVLDHGGRNDHYKNHVARQLPPHHLRIVKAIPSDGGSRADVQDTSILLKCHQKNPKAHRDVFGRMAWQRPAPTLTCRCTDVYCGRFIHPEQNRGISVREAAAIQTFDDDYEFFGGSILEQARQIGNAVPVRLARQLAESVLQAHGTRN